MRFKPGARAPAGERPEVYVVGGRGKWQSTFMEQPQSFNQKQREMFARLLQEARKREEVELESEHDVESQAESDAVAKLAEEQGVVALMAKVRKLRKEVEDAEEALGGLGFDCDEDGISLKWKAPKNLQQAVKAAKHAARKEREAALKRYDRAILGVWAAEDVQAARKIVEELL